MLINRQEVNHLFLKGQQFDESWFGVHVKIISENIYTNRHLDSNGNIFVASNSGGTGINVGEECICLAKCRDNLFIVPLAISSLTPYRDTWVKASDVTVLQSGGVNSTPIFMFIYCMEVMPS